MELVRNLQPQVRKFNYHIAIGGGVINRGFSDKDLDLYFLSMSNSDLLTMPKGLRAFLKKQFGAEFVLGGSAQTREDEPPDESSAYGPEPTMYYGRFTYRPEGRRIDVFISE